MAHEVPVFTCEEVNGWNCSLCTFLNNQWMNKCEICNTPKKQSQPNEWNCERCKFSNHYLMSVCKLCHAQKPGNSTKTIVITEEIKQIEPGTMNESITSINNEESKSISIKIRKPTTFIEKGDIISSHWIEPTTITNDNVEIKLLLNKPITKRKSFYIYQCGKEYGDPIAQYSMKKGETEDFEDLDLDEIEIDNTSSFSIALYQKEDDKQPISNILQITLPDNAEVSNNYIPNAILLSSIKAIEIDDEKEDDIFVYFDMPQKIRGDEIAFKIKYIDDDHDNKEEEYYISNPLKIAKKSIPSSFQIITSSSVDDEEYLSKPSDIITINYPKHPKQSKQIEEYDGNTKLSHFIQITQVTDDEFSIRLDVLDVDQIQRRKYDIKQISNKGGIMNVLGQISIYKKKQFGIRTIDIEEEHDDEYQIAIYDDNILSNTIKLRKFPINTGYPPNICQYKPKSVDISSIVKVLNKNDEKIYLYWNIPSLSFGKIGYKIVYNPDDEKKSNDIDNDIDDEIIDILPHSIHLSWTPITIQIITISSFDRKQCFSDPTHTILIDPKSAISEKEKWNEKPSYFMQITSIDEYEFCVELLSDKINDKVTKKFKIREIGKNGEESLNESICIRKKKNIGKAYIAIDQQHDESYNLALYQMENINHSIPNTNNINVIILKDEKQYPPLNREYKPYPIDLLTLFKVKDEKNNKIDIYWSTPPKSFGDLSYKIINDNNNDQKEEIIKLLPYSIPISSLPLSFKVITITTIKNNNYESDPSESINVGNIKKKKTSEPISKKKSKSALQMVEKQWKDKVFPDYLQVLGVDDETINIKLQLQTPFLSKQKCIVKNINNNNINQQINIPFRIQRNRKEITKEIEAKPNKIYSFAVFLDEIQISNAVTVKTSPINFHPDNNYTPLPPSKDSVEQYYDENNRNS